MKARVYYLDDELHLCEAFKEFMEIQGFEVAIFATAAECIETCRRDPPDIIFIDYRLADTTGDAVARAIPPKIHKVLVTGDLAGPGSSEFAATLGKPFRLGLAVDLVRRLCLAAGQT